MSTVDVDALESFEVRDTDESNDPALVCLDCGVTVCTVEHGDRLDVLVRTADDHWCNPPTH